VITGASSGMGKELTYRYAERGCRIVIGSRNIELLNSIAEECNTKYPNCNVVAVKTDVTKPEDC